MQILRCGLNTFDRKVLTYCSLAFLCFGYLGSWLYVYKKGGWSIVSSSERSIITSFLVGLTLYFAVWLLLDLFYRTVLIREKNPSHAMGFGVFLLVTIVAPNFIDYNAVQPMPGSRDLSERFYWIFYVISAAFLLTIVIEWSATIRFYRRISFRMPLQMLRLTLMTHQWFFLIGSLLLVVASVGGLYFPSYFPPFPPVLFFSLALLLVTHLALPPAILFLSSSKPENATLISRTSTTALPLKLVHLLDPSLPLSKYEAESFYGDSLRTVRDTSWRNVVDLLIEWVPLVVVDTRVATPAVVTETTAMLKPANRRRALFIVNQNGHGPALSLASGGPLENIKTTTVTEFSKAIRKELHARRTSRKADFL